MQLVIGNASPTKLEGTLQTRRLILRNTGASTIYFGYEPNVAAASGTGQGVPLKADEVLALDQSGGAFNDALYFICASGQTGTLNYTRREL